MVVFQKATAAHGRDDRNSRMSRFPVSCNGISRLPWILIHIKVGWPCESWLGAGTVTGRQLVPGCHEGKSSTV